MELWCGRTKQKVAGPSDERTSDKKCVSYDAAQPGVPLIYGGDEIGNSQNGNNNAYCQDNQVGWIDWKGMKKNRELLEFVKSAIAFRKEHPILHVPDELRGVDYKTKGLPDVSLHGERAWYMNSENTSRLLGIMYYGAYAKSGWK